jgi:N-acetylneuraminic acid mutarotase
MLAWGSPPSGYCDSPLPGRSQCEIGGRYDPATDRWKPTGPAPVSGRVNTPAIWTGREMLIWGGLWGDGGFALGGLAYDPDLDQWRTLSNVNAPTDRRDFVSAWTGNRMIVWGGAGLTTVGPGEIVGRSDGATYDPVSDRWAAISTKEAPASRTGAMSAWTGKHLLIWGGLDGTKPFVREVLSDGARYDPVADIWEPMSTLGAPTGRTNAATAWTGSDLLIWGGFGTDSTLVNDGAAYNPDTDTWHPIASAPDPPPDGASSVWTGTELFVWGPNPGARYNPATNTWSVMRMDGQPSGDRGLNVTIWTGKEMIVWGGSVRPKDALNDGARYTP